jgi:hypothetical protein
MRAATSVWLSPARLRSVASSRASSRRRVASTTSWGRRAFVRDRAATTSSRKSFTMIPTLKRERHSVKHIACELWRSASSPTPPIGQARRGQSDFVGRCRPGLLLKARQRQQDVGRLLCEEDSELPLAGLSTDLVDVAPQMPGGAETVPCDVIHGSKHFDGFLVSQAIDEGLDGPCPVRRAIVPPTEAMRPSPRPQNGRHVDPGFRPDGWKGAWPAAPRSRDCDLSLRATFPPCLHPP